MCAAALRAQDTIVKRDDVRLAVKITEITPAEVKYLRMDMQDGPLFVEKREEIRMIIYKNGQKEFFELPKEAPQPYGDSIFMKGNTFVTGQVEKLGRDEVRFRKASFKDGPVYSIPLANVERIHFAGDSVFYPSKEIVPAESIAAVAAAPGIKKPKELQITKEGRHYSYNQKKLTEKELHALLLGSGSPVIAELVKSAQKVKRKEVVFMICTFAGPTLLVFWPLFVVAEPGFVVAWLGIRKFRMDKNRDAVVLYNAG
ncbi:MAG: hypothetical protein JWO09_3233 [Bacteroidetes bacterium]|nr:hypothetical protein [Bacteroidota bacterium]